MNILAIDTSCDETAVAVTSGRKVLSHIEYTQILQHRQWGGIVPSIAKRAHEERIDWVVEKAMRHVMSNLFRDLLYTSSTPPSGRVVRSSRHRSNNKGKMLIRQLADQHDKKDETFVDSIIKNIDCVAVTQGPGLAIALEVGIKKAKELAGKYNKNLIAVNHLEGHIYSVFAQNSKGNPIRPLADQFPIIVLLVSGRHTELVIFKNHLDYEVIGKTLDDAAGEALDKAARMLGFGYPGGQVIERLADEAGNSDIYKFPRPMLRSNDLNFSYSGLKTAFYYHLMKMEESEKVKKVRELASSFQSAVFDSLLIKTELAIKQTGINRLIVAGGVAANMRLRHLTRQLVKKHNGEVLFPHYKYLNGDNAAMIGVAAYYKSLQRQFVSDIDSLDRIPRLSL